MRLPLVGCEAANGAPKLGNFVALPAAFSPLHIKLHMQLNVYNGRKSLMDFLAAASRAQQSKAVLAPLPQLLGSA